MKSALAGSKRLYHQVILKPFGPNIGDVEGILNRMQLDLLCSFDTVMSHFGKKKINLCVGEMLKHREGLPIKRQHQNKLHSLTHVDIS